MNGSWAADDALKEKSVQALWYVVRPGYMVALFLLGWAANVALFQRHCIDYGAVLGITKDEMVSVRFLVVLAAFLALLLSLLRTMAFLHGPSAELLAVVLAGYLLAALVVLGGLPRPAMKHCRWREPFTLALWRCVWPDGSKEIPFAEVLVADGLTSVAKLFFDLTFGTCIVSSCRYRGVETAALGEVGLGTLSPLARPELNAAAELASAVEQCSRSCLPYLAWSVPFLIRARQCVITARHAPDALSRDLQRINLAKYCSALPVVFFAMCHARVIPGISDLSIFTSEDFEVLWALAAIVNSAFSFIWDLVMDWGLLHLMPHKPGNFGLRPVLLYPQPPIVYYLAIVLNFIGRTLWSLRWSEQATIFLGAFFLSSVQQAAEVLRRCLWRLGTSYAWNGNASARANVHETTRVFQFDMGQRS